MFVSEKRSVWDHVLVQDLAEHQKCSEEVVFPGHVVWGVLLNLIKNLNFCGWTARVARLLMLVQWLQGFAKEWLPFDIRHTVSASKISCTG